MDLGKFTDDQSYLVSGKTLNRLSEFMRADWLVEGPGLLKKRDGSGKVTLSLAENSSNVTFDFKVRGGPSGYRVFGGTINGLGMSNLTPTGLEDGEWSEDSVGSAGLNIWIKVEFQPTSIQIPSYAEDGGGEAVWVLDGGGTNGSATLGSGASIPEHVNPGVSATNGSAQTNGVFYIRIARLTEGGVNQNIDGTLWADFCPPQGFRVYSTRAHV